MSSTLTLESMLAEIESADSQCREQAERRENSLTKPPGSLGRLEELAIRLCAMQRTLQPTATIPTIFTFAADHGVCEEGVNAYPQSVTRQMVANFLAGGAAINAISESVEASLTLVDVGVIGPPIHHPNLLSRQVAAGTRNFCQQPAMSEEQALSAIGIGMDCAEQAIGNGSTLLGIGEMGIGNTTVASAICAAMTNTDPDMVCGPGTGSDRSALQRKKDAVRRALALHTPHISRPLDLLSRLGGFEIAAMCGVCIAAARNRCPVLMDGFISTAAATIAVALKPKVRDYLIAAHQSPEPGHRVLLEHLSLDPILCLNMRLGEGTGAALAIPVVRAAIATFRSMATFESAGVAQECPQPST